MRRLFRLWQIGGQDLLFLLKTLRQPGRPQWLLPALLILMFFAFEPLNFALPLVGVIDDFVMLPLLLRGLAKLAAGTVRKRDDRVVSVQ
jgi:uncharacterized membrane protein YkvA (DUF1232 family)